MTPCNVLQCQLVGGTCTSTPCTGCDAALDIAQVGSLPAGLGRYGHFDLGGNVAELALDFVDKSGNGGLVTPCVDCAVLMPAVPADSGAKAASVFTLGGDWTDGATSLRTTGYSTPRFTDTSAGVGFRCARD